MFTQQAPFLLSALQGAVDSTTSRQLLQAFANCNQPLTHRGGVSLQQSALPQQGGVLRAAGGPSNYAFAGGGASSGGDITLQLSPWASQRGDYYGDDANSVNVYNQFRPGSQFFNSYPDQAGDAFYNTNQSFQFGPISNVNNSQWYTRMGDMNTFDFSIRQGDVINNYAGPTFQVAGDTYYDNSVSNTQTVNQQNVTEQYVTNQITENTEVKNITIVTGDPAAAGPAGPPGANGQPGRNGADGADGLPGPAVVLPIRRARLMDFKGFKVAPQFREIEVVTGVVFDPDACRLQLATSTVKYVSAVDVQAFPLFLNYYGP